MSIYHPEEVQTEKLKKAIEEVQTVIVGQQEMLNSIFIGLLTGGHILIEGVPGLAKTLAISSVAKVTSLDFKRVQFTPDLLPTDIVGTMIFNSMSQVFSVKKGPVFTHILLADEINRAPAKVQSALLEAMAEKQVTIGDNSFAMEDPFLVLATQNPIEQEGTYNLPEAQLDRFLFKVKVSYSTRSEEMEILKRMSSLNVPVVQPVLSVVDILAFQKKVDELYLDDKLRNYIVDLVMATRKPKDYGLMDLEPFISFGASPRATVYFPKAAKAHAFIKGRNYVSADDVKAVAYPILRHRILLSYEAQAEDLGADQVIDQIIRRIRVS
ncbi:MAG: MoxR family ATPase [Bdellovibrionales bacterium]|nr:MoxR family ATPase [Bdellovibrionales bacterium]